jgi:hypothetical protein
VYISAVVCDDERNHDPEKNIYKVECGVIRTSNESEGRIRVPWRSKHPLLTGHTRCKPLVEIRYA